MARTVTTESIESKNKVFGSYTIFDIFFIMVFMLLSYGLMSYVHPHLRIIYMIFSLLVSIFLVSKSLVNKTRKNYESLYFMMMRDVAVYRPYYGKEE